MTAMQGGYRGYIGSRPVRGERSLSKSRTW